MRRVLFVGAPFGKFFRYLAPALEDKGVAVWRTVSDGGEFFATPARNRVIFRGKDDDANWRAFLEQTMRSRHISAIVTFNDSCRRTRAAHELADKLGIARYVLEEGYIRPWWITFDHVGVNGNSLLPKDPKFYSQEVHLRKPHVAFKHSFKHLVRHTIAHFTACTLMSPILPYDPKYYGDSVYTQAKGYLREYLWRKTHSETGVLRMLRDLHRRKAGDIFVSLMQKPGDAQLRFHSEYRANNPYLREVMSSFACHADKTALLVIKQHPLDYGIENSKVLFNELVAQHGLEGRAVYIRKLTIESVLAVASGLITINSTGGLAAIEQLVPTIALGKAIYNVPGMTFQDGLDRFWTVRSAPDPQVVRAFVDYLMVQTQINGGYYSHKSLTLLTKNLSEAMLNGAMAPHFVQAKRPVHYRSFGLKTPIGPAPAAVPVRS